LYPLTRNERGQQAFKNGTWNHYRIEAVGKHIKTWVNGIQCANLVDDLSPQGFIAFQVHSIGPNEPAGQQVKWRNAQILTEGVADALQNPRNEVVEISYLTNQLTASEKWKGWQLLWDGQQLSEWAGIHGLELPQTGLEVIDDQLILEEGIAIQTQTRLHNFEISIDFKLSDDSEAGIAYLSDYTDEGILIGPEYQLIADDYPDYAIGEKNQDRSTGALNGLIPPENLSEANRNSKRFDRNQFNRARIVVVDGHVEHWLNEIKVVEYNCHAQALAALVNRSFYSDITKDLTGFAQTLWSPILLNQKAGKTIFKNIKIRSL
jgi:hypothetical protein